MSTVYRVRGIHITAASRPAYSLGLFGHRNNPFLESFEKATEVCGLISCKSWPSRKYGVKSHREVFRSPRNWSLCLCEDGLQFQEAGKIRSKHTGLLCFKASRCCPFGTHPRLCPLHPVYVSFVSLSFGDKKTMELLRTFVFQLVMENIIRGSERWWNVELHTLGGFAV